MQVVTFQFKPLQLCKEYNAKCIQVKSLTHHVKNIVLQLKEQGTKEALQWDVNSNAAHNRYDFPVF
jgi:hypothetical protein